MITVYDSQGIPKITGGAGREYVCNVFHPYNNEPPSSNYATLDIRNQHPVMDFDDSVDESVVFTGIFPIRYGGNGITIIIHWTATTSTTITHYCRWEVAFEALDNQDIDSDGFSSAQSAGGNPNTTCGVETTTSISFTDGSQMDNIVAGGAYRLRINRDADGGSGTDDMSGDAELVIVEVRENT